MSHFPPRRKLSTPVHLAPVERTIINCKYFAARLPAWFRLAARAVSRRLCIDSSPSLSSMFPSLVASPAGEPFVQGIISVRYTRAYVHKSAFSIYLLRIEARTTPRVTPRHAMPCHRRVASCRVASVLYKVLHQARSRHCATGGLRCGFVRVEWELEVISLRHNAQ